MVRSVEEFSFNDNVHDPVIVIGCSLELLSGISNKNRNWKAFHAKWTRMRAQMKKSEGLINTSRRGKSQALRQTILRENHDLLA
jgi:hypothetical protein